MIRAKSARGLIRAVRTCAIPPETQEQAARKIGISVRSWGRYEQVDHSAGLTARVISEYMGAPWVVAIGDEWAIAGPDEDMRRLLVGGDS